MTDEETKIKYHLKWARLLVHSNGSKRLNRLMVVDRRLYLYLPIVMGIPTMGVKGVFKEESQMDKG